MSLHGVLSAMREIILDIDPIPATLEKRQVLYKERFPELSEHELEDLAKIEAERFATYTTSIFSGEKGILKNHFSLTLGFLKKHWNKVYGTELIEFEFIRALHKARPWRSYTTEFLLNCFLEYLEGDLINFHSNFPQVLDLAMLEYSSYVIKRHHDDPISPKDNISLESLKSLTVDELLSRKGFVPTCVQIKTFEHDVVKVFQACHLEGIELPERIAKTQIFAMGGRNAENYVRWTEVSEAVHQLFSSAGNGNFIDLSALAEAVISEAPATVGEEALFVAFLETLIVLMKCGVVCVR